MLVDAGLLTAEQVRRIGDAELPSFMGFGGYDGEYIRQWTDFEVRWEE